MHMAKFLDATGIQERGYDPMKKHRQRFRFMSRVAKLLVVVLALPAVSHGQAPTEHREFVSVQAPVVALRHVRIIDGTGAPALLDQTIVITGDKISLIGDS